MEAETDYLKLLTFYSVQAPSPGDVTAHSHDVTAHSQGLSSSELIISGTSVIDTASTCLPDLLDDSKSNPCNKS